MKKSLLLFSILAATAVSSFSATPNTWYGNTNSNTKVTQIRCFFNQLCWFSVTPSPAPGDMFFFNAESPMGKNWLSLLTTAKSTGQGVEFFVLDARPLPPGSPPGTPQYEWNISSVGIR